MPMRIVSVALVFAAFILWACDSPPDASPKPLPSPTLPMQTASVLVPTPKPSASGSSAPASVAAETPPTVIAAQHILIAYKGAKGAPKQVTRSKAEAKKRADEVLERIKKGEDFSQLVKTFSEDPGSADRMGSVGKFDREKMVKAFSDAAFALKVDEVSGVVETPFGFHLIKRNQ
jgi:peptidyl-prolyl cis-trans isomerase NIMA-interacting 1